MKPAAFLDRDGTVIEQVHYLKDPAQVVLIHRAGEAIRMLNSHGYTTVIVTNQSAIGRGLMTNDDLTSVHEEMRRQLALEGASVDAIYHCPVVPKIKSREVVEHPDRKPGAGMLQRAASELGLDLHESWMVGDMISDILAGRNAGCHKTIMVQTGYGVSQSQGHSAVDFVVENIYDAAQLIVAGDRPGPKPLSN